MAKKGDFIHIRSDAKLHEALKASATRAHRKMQDQARYLLEKALGIAYQEDAVIDERLRAAGATNARWNDWRHTFASDLTMAGHSDRTVAHLLGHTSTQMVARYAHLSEPHLRQAVETMANKWPTARQPKTRTTR